MATAKCNKIDARIASNRVRRSRFRCIKRMAERRTRSAEEASLAPSSHYASTARISQRLSSHKSGANLIPNECEGPHEGPLTRCLVFRAALVIPSKCARSRTWPLVRCLLMRAQ